MIHGIKIIIFTLLFVIFSKFVYSEDRIISTPLINLNELKPSFEDVEKNISDFSTTGKIKIKKDLKSNGKVLSANFIGLDKITAKTSLIKVNLGETKRFGPLEIKVLKCGKSEKKDKNSVAYIQVKDLTENDNEKVFIFNGWTFSSDPTLAPFDHAIYDLQLVKCDNV